MNGRVGDLGNWIGHNRPRLVLRRLEIAGFTVGVNRINLVGFVGIKVEPLSQVFSQIR